MCTQHPGKNENLTLAGAFFSQLPQIRKTTVCPLGAYWSKATTAWPKSTTVSQSKERNSSQFAVFS
jgi:hypothetical protein